MSREAHVQFCERLGVRLPGATHPFQVLLAHQLEESLPVAVQMLQVQQMGIVRWNQPAKHPAAIQKRHRA
jgi:hypothetical protein